MSGRARCGARSQPPPKIERADRPDRRGEAVRIALHAAGIKTTDKFLIYSEYQDLKAKTDDPAWKNGLPVLSVGGGSS